jgi:hypothetical protein
MGIDETSRLNNERKYTTQKEYINYFIKNYDQNLPK